MLVEIIGPIPNGTPNPHYLDHVGRPAKRALRRANPRRARRITVESND